MTLSVFGFKMEGKHRALGLKEFLISASKLSSFQSSLVPIHGQRELKFDLFRSFPKLG